MNDNAGGYAGAVINYNSPSPAEMLQQGAVLNEHRQEKAALHAKQLADNRLHNYEYAHNVGHDFKPLPGQLQEIVHGQIQALQDKYTDPKYLELDPATFRAMLDNDTKGLATAYDNASNGAQEFEKSFERYAQDNPNIPKAQAYKMGVDRFVNNHLTYGPDGKMTFMPPQQTNGEDVVNDYLSDPEVKGQMDIPLGGIAKTFQQIPLKDWGTTEVTDNKGFRHKLSLSGKTNDFLQFTKDANGIPVGVELGYSTPPGTDIKTISPELQQYLLGSRENQNEYYRQKYLAKQHLTSRLGQEVDPHTLEAMTQHGLYQQLAPLAQGYVKKNEEQKIPKPPVTVNNINLGKEPLINDVYGAVSSQAAKLGDKEFVRFNALPTDVQTVLMKQVRSVTGEDEDGNKLDFSNVAVRKDKDGQLFLTKIEKVNGKDHFGNDIFPITYTGANLPANTAAKQKQEVLHNAQSGAGTPVPATHTEAKHFVGLPQTGKF